MHKSMTLLVALFASTTLFVGCAGNNWTGGDTGAVLGGALGGIAGHQIGGGSGKTIATVAGAVVGSMLGRRVGNSMSRRDRNRFGRALETNEAGESSTWSNESSQDRYEVTPTSQIYQAENSQPCREFTMDAMVDGQPDQVTGTACRQPDGSWVIQ